MSTNIKTYATLGVIALFVALAYAYAHEMEWINR